MFTAAVLALSACGLSGDESAENSLRGPDLQRALGALTTGAENAAVGLVMTDAETWRGASGFADRPSKRRAKVSDQFSIGSTTKTFVAAVVLQLVGEGRLSLEDRVEKWLPAVLREGKRITVRQLLNHTSGLPDDSSFDATPRERLRFVDPLPLQFRPGTRHSYSNTNFVVLGVIVEAVTGNPLAEVIRDRIFRPLELEHTSYGTKPRSATDQPPTWLGAPGAAAGSAVSGDGGIVSTVDDLARFYRALLGGQLLGSDELAEMTRHVDAGLQNVVRAGLGLFRFLVPCGFAWGHAGEEPLYSSISLASRDGSRVVVVAQNRSGWDIVKAVADQMYCG